MTLIKTSSFYKISLWILLFLLFTLLIIVFFYKSFTYVDLHGIKVKPSTSFCVSQLALVDGDCVRRKDMSCEELVRMYEVSCDKDAVYRKPKK
ncbi:hypothetical protein MCEORH2_01000 [Methylophilaceae bacterium]